MEALARGRRTTIHCMAWPQKLGILLVIQTYQLQAGLVGFVFHLFWLFFHLQTRITERETGCALPAIQHHRGGGGPRTHSQSSLYAPARCALFPGLCFGCALPPPLFHHSAWVELIASFRFWTTHLLLSTHWWFILFSGHCLRQWLWSPSCWTIEFDKLV